MKLTEMLGQYEELLDKKDQLAKDTKDNNAAIDKLKAEIAEMMIDEDIPSQGYGDYIYSLQDKVKYSKRGEAYLQERGLDFFEVLREQGLGELIKETVNAGSLQSAMKEIAEENDGELPPELDHGYRGRHRSARRDRGSGNWTVLQRHNQDPIRSFIQRHVLHRKHHRAAAPDTQRIYAVHGSKDRSNRILPDQSRGTRQSQDNHTRQGSQGKEDGIRGRA